ncbi:MAG: class I SAM-dependent methyltransferase [Candidatus Aenigmarchaeota archaeon]|nr:class I SAM-dependent methyltransferase [Candidatus Aenigmarchaeota archaeon]
MENQNHSKEVKKNLREVYDTIADSWTNLRVKPDEFVNDFAEKNIGSPLLDLATGNGRNLVPFLNKNIKCIGIDFSRNMIKEAKKFLSRRKLTANFIIADITKLPFKEKTFKTILAVAIIHHLETREKRLKALREVKRVSNNSNVLISVWKDETAAPNEYKLWRYHGKEYKRFYHFYSLEEIDQDLKESGFVKFNHRDDKKNFVIEEKL